MGRRESSAMRMHWKPASRVVLALALAACSTRSENVRFNNGDVALAGSVVLPRTGTKHPAVVFVHGDGPETREASRHFARQFAARGVAALIYDKRGSGESTGRLPARFDDLAADAVAGIRYLRSREDIDPQRIGLWGGSQGAWIALLAASSPEADVRFVVSKSGAAVTPAELALSKSLGRVASTGYGSDAEAQVRRLMEIQFEILRSGNGWEQLEADVRRVSGEPWLPHVALMRHSRWRSSWMTYGQDIDFDPVALLSALDVPVLWLLGERDPEVPLGPTLERLEALRKSGRKITVKVFSGADHQIELPRTNARRPNYAPGYMESMVEWVVEQSRDRDSGNR